LYLKTGEVVSDMDNSILTSEDFPYIDCRISKEKDKDKIK
jgi:hypothetical protein